MSYNGHVVIDADSHIHQAWDLDRTYKPNMDPAYREKYERFSAAARARIRFPGDSPCPDFLWPASSSRPMGVYDTYDGPQAATRERDLGGAEPGAAHRQVLRGGRVIAPECNWDPAVRLADMEKAGIDVSVIFPSSSDSFCAINDVGFEAALGRAYSCYMADYCV